MHSFANALRTFPQNLQCLAAAWFLCCGLFELCRNVFIWPLALFLPVCIAVSLLLILVCWRLSPGTAPLALGLAAVFYAWTLVATRVDSTRYPLFLVILFAVGVVLFPLLNRHPEPLLRRPLSRRIGIGLLVVAGLLFAISLAAITCLRYLTFSSPNYDFGIFVQMFHNMKETLIPLTTCERNELLSHFAVHISPIYYLILPFYCLIPSPLTLQIAQVVILASGLIPLYRLTRCYALPRSHTVLLGALYALYPPLSTGCFYDLHENCFLVPLLLWLFVCYEEGHFRWMLLPAALILLTKEDAAVYLIFFALYLAISRRDMRRSLPLAGGALLYFCLAIFLLQQFGTGAMFGRYGELLRADKATGGLFGTLLRDPGYFLEQIASTDSASEKLLWLLQLLLPLGALLWTPRGHYSRLLLLAPLLLNLLTQYAYQYNINFQYNFGSIPFLFYLLIQNTASAKHPRNHLLFGVITACFMYTFMVLPTLQHLTTAYVEKHETWVRMEELLDTIPEEASVTTSSMLLPHLAQRRIVYETHYHPQPDTDYVILDLRGNWRESSEEYRTLCLSYGYTVVTEEEDLMVILKAQT